MGGSAHGQAGDATRTRDILVEQLAHSSFHIVPYSPWRARVRATMVSSVGLALKDHGRARTLTGQHGRPVCGQTTRVAGAPTF